MVEVGKVYELDMKGGRSKPFKLVRDVVARNGSRTVYFVSLSNGKVGAASDHSSESWFESRTKAGPFKLENVLGLT